jgi:TetR/AcrR family transcriptional regulator, cholesterol catabolism regulator
LYSTLTKGMELRDMIIEGAAHLFKTYGIKAVTMDSLASHLGISKRTIYEVFADKDELLVCVFKWMEEKQKALVSRILDESENAIYAIFMLLERNRDHFQDMSPAFQADMRRYQYLLLLKKTGNSEMPDYKNNMQVIVRGIREKLFRKDINPDIANRCLASLGRSIMDFDLYPFEEFSRREVVKNVFINYMKGISTNEGIELINKLEAEF